MVLANNGYGYRYRADFDDPNRFAGLSINDPSLDSHAPVQEPVVAQQTAPLDPDLFFEFNTTHNPTSNIPQTVTPVSAVGYQTVLMAPSSQDASVFMAPTPESHQLDFNDHNLFSDFSINDLGLHSHAPVQQLVLAQDMSPLDFNTLLAFNASHMSTPNVPKTMALAPVVDYPTPISMTPSPQNTSLFAAPTSKNTASVPILPGIGGGPVTKTLALSAPVLAELPYKLHIRPMRRENRAETESSLELILDGPKIAHTRLHFAPETVWLAKNLAKPNEREARSDTLEVSAMVFCASAVKDASAIGVARYIAAYVPASDLTSSNGGPVRICPQCQRREHCRKSRKKIPIDPEFDSYIGRRVIGISTKEYSQLQPYHHDESEPWDRYAAQRLPTDTFITKPNFSTEQRKFEAGIRILCKCNHHQETDGFHIIFTIRDSNGLVVGQGISSSIIIKDVAKKEKRPRSESSSELGELGELGDEAWPAWQDNEPQYM
jgi:hypothetical protein